MLTQQPGGQGNLRITQTWEIKTRILHCHEERSFYPQLKCEVVKVQPNCNGSTDTFHELSFPIDCLNQRLMAMATQLANLRCITLDNPLSWEFFWANSASIMAMALQMITHAPSLTKITLCAAVLSDKIVHALSSQSCLQDVQLLLPNVSCLIPNKVAQIGDLLSRGIHLLSQVEAFKIPIGLATSTVLSCLGQSPRLYHLEITGSANVQHPGYSFVRSTEFLRSQNIGFPSLQLLSIKNNIPKEGLLSKHILSKKFPNIQFIKT